MHSLLGSHYFSQTETPCSFDHCGGDVAWDSIPLKVVRGYQLIDPPDHNMPFEIIPLKVKVDTKHRLLMRNTCNSAAGNRLRSSAKNVLQAPRSSTKFGDCSFSVERPTAWNSLPDHVNIDEYFQNTPAHSAIGLYLHNPLLFLGPQI